MSLRRGELVEPCELLSIIEELDQKVLEAIKRAEEKELVQVIRVLGTIKSYIDLLKRELEVEGEL